MRTVRRVGAAAVALAVAGGAYAAYAAAAEPEAAYRTATVSVADVAQTLALSGTLAPASSADLAFGADGTLARLAVGVGDTVEGGDLLARLDLRALRRTVRDAESSVAAARARLESDRAAQAETVTAAATTTAAPSSSTVPTTSAQQPTERATSKPTGAESAPVSTALADLDEQQDAVTTAQSAATAAITAARTALETQTTTCADAFAADPVTTEEPAAEPSDELTEEPAAGTDPADAACTTALAAVQTAQATVATAQDDLQVALETLAGTLADAADTLGSDGTTPTQTEQPQAEQPQAEQPQTEQPQAEAPSTGTTTPSGGAAASTVTAVTLARDQASIDEARAGLVAARQALASATLRAPYDGTVVDVTVERGAAASAGTTVVTVVPHGTTTVEVAATEAQVRELEVGQAAAVTPAGADEPLSGEVSSVGAVPDASTGTTTYAVVVSLDGSDLALPTGATASVAVEVGTAEDALTVPTSAVTSGSVLVVDGTTATRTRVETGVVGASRTEILSGLEEGQQVALADLTAALPSGETGATVSFSGLGGGGGAPGGGFGVPSGRGAPPG